MYVSIVSWRRKGARLNIGNSLNRLKMLIVQGSELYMLEKKLRDVEGNTLSLDEGHSLRLRAMKVFHR